MEGGGYEVVLGPPDRRRNAPVDVSSSTPTQATQCTMGTEPSAAVSLGTRGRPPSLTAYTLVTGPEGCAHHLLYVCAETDPIEEVNEDVDQPLKYLRQGRHNQPIVCI